MESDDLSNSNDLEVKLGSEKGLSQNLLKPRVNKEMEKEEKKFSGKKIEVGIDSDDNEPIGSLFRLKRPRNPRKVKVGLEKVEVREDKDEDMGGMDDTLASFKKKLKGPKKDLGYVSAGHGEGDGLLNVNVENKVQKSKERARKVRIDGKRVRTRGDVVADDSLEGLGSQGALLENQEEERWLPGGSSNWPLDEKLEDSISAFFQKKQSGLARKSRANSSFKQINRVRSLDDRLSPESEVGFGDSKDLAVRTIGSGSVSSVVCKDLEAENSFHTVGDSNLLDSSSRQILHEKNQRLDNGSSETSYFTNENSDRIKGIPAMKDETMKSDDKRHGKSSEFTAEVSAPVTPTFSSQHGVMEDKQMQDPCISNTQEEPMVEPYTSERIWNESHSASGHNDGFETRTLKIGLKLCSVGKASTLNALEQQSKDASAACISNAEPQISLSSDGREISASSSPNSQNELQVLDSVPKNENVEISDGRLSPVTVISGEVHKSLHTNHNGNSLDYISINEEANGMSPRSVTPEENESYLEDAVSVPGSDTKDGHLAAVQRAVRKAKKRRLGDMAYEGDADWEILINEQQFLENDQAVESDRSLRTREKSDSSSNSVEAENGGMAAVSAGLKACAAGPVEKIKFKEVLKRKGGLQEYLECRNRILCLWSKDISRILPLADCGVTKTPSQDESPRASLIRQIYGFLDQSGYINAGIASEKERAEPSTNHNYKLVEEKAFEGNPGASVTDLEDGVSFILGQVKSSENSLEPKNGVAVDHQDLASRALKSGELVTPMTPDLPNVMEYEGLPAAGIQENSVSNSKLPNGLSSLDPLSTDPSCTMLDGRMVTSITPELRDGLQSVKSNSCTNIGESHKLACDSEERKKIIVIGAGPAGLSAARHLQRQGFSAIILEGRNRIGGRVYTDRSSLSVPVDLGASIITGVEADVTTERRPDPSSLICAQLGLELTLLNSDCPLYDVVTGEKVPTDLDEELESEYNSLLDDMVLVIAQKGQHAMKMSLEDGLDYALKTRRMAHPGPNIDETESGTAENTLYDSKTCSVDGGAHERSCKEEILSPLERRVMDWHFAHLEYGCAASLKEVSLPYWNQDDIYGGFGGAHCMIKGGYSNVVESLGEGLHIHLNHVATDISYGIKDAGENKSHRSKVKVCTSNGSEFLGDAVLITVPLGCLKAETIKFSPPLPQWKRSSIQRLGFGVLNKVVLEFPVVFWDDSVDYFGATAEETDQRGHCFMFWNVKKTVGAPVLIALVAGKAAINGQRMSSSDHVSHALMVLRKLFGESLVPDPVASVVTDWGRDPFSYGAYSYVAIGSSGEDYDILGRPVENCVFFAGEATCKEHPDTVGGAMMSGLREAVRIIDILSMGTDYTAEVEAMEGAQRHSEVERDEVRDITKRLEAVELSNVLYKNSLDRARLLTREALLRDMFFSAKTTAGRLLLAKKLLNLPVGTLKSFAGTKKGLAMLNSWILDSMGKDGTQLLRHCVRLLVLVSTDLLAVRLSGIGKTVKEKVCVHTSRDIRAIASQLVSVWLEVFRREKASNGGAKFSRHAALLDSSKRKYFSNSTSGKPPLRTHHSALETRGNLQVSAPTRGSLPSNPNTKKASSKLETLKDSSRLYTEVDEGNTAISEEEQAALAAAEAARAAARAAAQAYASSEAKCSTLVQLPKIPSFHKFARREQYAQMDEYDLRRKWSGGILGKQDCISEIDSRNCRVRDWSVDFSAACANFDSSRMSGDNLSQRSHSNEIACHMNFREQSGESAAVDSSLFTKAWVDTTGSAGIKDYHAIERWQCQAAAADSDFFNRAMRIKDEEDSNTSSRPPTRKHDGRANESSISQDTINKEPSKHHSRGADRIKQAVVDFVSSLLMPVYKARKIDKEGYKSIMKKSATKVMEKATDAEKVMAVSEFLDFKRKNKIRAFVDKLIENHMAMKPAVEP